MAIDSYRLCFWHNKLFNQPCFNDYTGPAITAHSGKVLVRNPNPEVREGSASGVAVVIEFESLEIARTFYESEQYTQARAVRETAAETDLILVEGL